VTGSSTSSRQARALSWLPLMSPLVVSVCIKSPPPHGPLPKQLPAKHYAVLYSFVSRGSLHCANLPDKLVCVHTVLNPWSLGLLCSPQLRTLLYSYFRSCTVCLCVVVRARRWHYLTRSSCLSRLPNTEDRCRHIPRMAFPRLNRPNLLTWSKVHGAQDDQYT
jgi:hypothetical protein